MTATTPVQSTKSTSKAKSTTPKSPPANQGASKPASQASSRATGQPAKTSSSPRPAAGQASSSAPARQASAPTGSSPRETYHASPESREKPRTEKGDTAGLVNGLADNYPSSIRYNSSPSVTIEADAGSAPAATSPVAGARTSGSAATSPVAGTSTSGSASTSGRPDSDIVVGSPGYQGTSPWAPNDVPDNNDQIHAALDVVGLVPVLGEVADGTNALIYAGEGDYLNAGISAVGVIPGVGQAATIGRRTADVAAESLPAPSGESAPIGQCPLPPAG